MSGKKPLGERPLSEQAVSNALIKVVGSKTTDEIKYKNYQSVIANRQPSYWSHIQQWGEFCERSARITEYPANLQQHHIIGGGIIYFASAEEQALIERRYVPPINYLKAEKAFKALAVTDSETQGDLNELGSAFSDLLSDDQKAYILDSGHSGHIDIFRAMPEEKKAAFDPESELAEKAKRATTRVLKNLTLASVDFLRKERSFVKVMNEWWWNDIDPQISTGQLIGATITRQMIWPPK